MSCNDAISQVRGLEILNDCEENRQILMKLPESTRSRWNRTVTARLKGKKGFPSFDEFVEFLNNESDVANNSIFINMNDKFSASNDSHKNSKSTSKVFSTNASAGNNAQSPGSTITPITVPATLNICDVCSGNHSIEKCFKFKRMPVEQRRDFTRENRLCFGCLGLSMGRCPQDTTQSS